MCVGVCMILYVHVCACVCVHERGPSVALHFLRQGPGQHHRIQAGQMHDMRQKERTETNGNMGASLRT